MASPFRDAYDSPLMRPLGGSPPDLLSITDKWFSPIELSSKAPHNPIAQLATTDVLHHSIDPNYRRKTGIICTIGPKSRSVEMLIALRKAGMNVARLNFSHGTHEYHQETIDNIHKSFEVCPGPAIAIALDTKGPEIRTGNMKEGIEQVKLISGEKVIVSVNEEDKNSCDEKRVYVDYKNLPLVVKVGSQIFIDDGLIDLAVVNVDAAKGEVECIVRNEGALSSHKGVNLPSTDVDLPSVSEQDKKDLLFGKKNNVDYVFASFIRSATAIDEIRSILGADCRAHIISKIENHQGIENFDSILAASDGIMVARGDMGIEIPAERVFLAQKMIISKCNIIGKPVICATQMLESMTTNPRPTRAEVSDVANAVIDGADCVMLSGETAKGLYPIHTVETMDMICKEAEGLSSNLTHYHALLDIHPDMYQTSETLAGSAVSAAFTRKLKGIIVFSISGKTARLVSKYHPPCPIVCVTTDPITARQASVSRGVIPILVNEHFVPGKDSWLMYMERQLKNAVEQCKEGNILKDGDLAVVVQGWAGGEGHSNTMRLVQL